MKIFFLILLVLGLAKAAPQEDLVASLPNMTTFTFPMYSGYLKIPNTGKSLHYIFAESQKAPATDPLIIWFNGGPGCSSLLGFIQEHGPWVMEDETKTFHENEYSWNKETNIVYIESPAGVGFSVCEKQEECSFDDYNTGEDNFQAVLAFFNKFPEFNKNDLFLSGESYAGIYVPHLAWQIYNWNMDSSNTFKFNMKGFMVGNPVTDWEWDADPAMVKLSYYFNLYGLPFKKRLDHYNCTYNYIDVIDDDLSPECDSLLDTFQNKYTQYLNVYDLYRRCFTPSGPSNSESDNEVHPQLGPYYGEVQIGNETKRYKRIMSSNEYTPWLYKKDFKKTPKYLLKDNPHPGPPPPNPLGTCEFGIPYIDWLNSASVREALHIPQSVQKWQSCSDIDYTKNIEASEWIYEILRNKYKMMVYSGDTDGAVPTYGTLRWMKKVNWKIIDAYRPYYVQDQVAGYVQEREGFTFGTVHGCGHMAPQWKRAQTYHLIFNWVLGKDI